MIALVALLFAAETAPEAPADEVVEEAPTGPDRSKPPEVAPPEVMVYPDPEVHRLSEGVEVRLVRVPFARKVEVIVSPGKGMVESENHPSFTRAVGWLADYATDVNGTAQLSELEDLYDLDVSSYIGNHHGQVAVEVPLEELHRGVQLLSETLHGASFPKTDVKRFVLDTKLYYDLKGPADPDSVGKALMAGAWFPPDHPYGLPPDPSQLDRLSSSVLAESFQGWLRSAPITVLVVGDLAWDDVKTPITEMMEGLGQAGERAKVLPVPQPTAIHARASHVEGQEQVGIAVRLTAPPVTGDCVPAIAGNFVLGGHFLSRLNANLREEKGWTYGSRSRYSFDEHAGYITISVDVKSENLAGAVREIEAELGRLAESGVTPEELSLTFRSTVAEHNRVMMTASSAAGWYSAHVQNGEDPATQIARQRALSEVTPEQVQAVAARHWGPGTPRVWTFVGDRARMEPQLAELGLDVVWVDPKDAILGKVPPAP